MKCNEIAKQSILYIENSLKKNNAKRFKKHLQKCENCRKQFNIIASNYDCSMNSDSLPDMKADIMNEINHSRYLEHNAKRHMRRWTVIAVGLALLIGVSVNAQDIFKSLDELIKSMSPTNEYLEHRNRAAGEDRTDSRVQKSSIPIEEYDDMFSKVKEKVFEKGNEILPGEYAEILYPELHEGFCVKMCKLSSGELEIRYGIKDCHQMGFGVNMAASSDKNVVQQTINKGYFIALPGYLPENYSFKKIVTSDGRVQRISFSDENDNHISIDYEFYTNYRFKEFETSLVKINDMQAIYLETEVGSKVLHLYLGDNLNKKVIKLSAQSIGKEELFNIAKSLVFYNEESNLLNKDNYFKEIKDKRLENIFDEVISREKAGDKMFEIYVSGKKGDKETVRFNKNDAGPGGWCMVNYRGMSYEDVKQNLNYPMIFDKTVISRFKLDGAAVSFRPFHEVKIVRYALMPDDGSIKGIVFIEARGLPIEYRRYTKLDYLMMKYISANDTEIINDDKGQHYTVRRVQDDICIETIREIEGRYISYTINLPSELYKGMEYEGIINNIDFIE